MINKQSFYHGYIEIIDISLYNFAGKRLDIRSIFGEMDIQEDLFAPTCTGSVGIMDASNIYEDFPIIGEETIKITYKDNTKTQVTRSFDVYAVSNKTKVGDRAFFYTLKFCSPEFLMNRTKLISKAYTNKTADEIVTAVVKSDLGSTKPVLVEKTVGIQNYIAPTVYPFEITSAMCTRGKSLNNQKGASYVFYEDKTGFNFVPIETLIKKPAIKYTLDSSASHTSTNTKFNVMKYYMSSPANTMGNITGGSFGCNVKALDLFNKKMIDVSYNHFDDKQYSQVEHINSTNPKLKLTTSKYKYKSTDGMYKVIIANSDTGIDESGSMRETNVAVRYAQLGVYANGPKLNIEVSFNSALTVGGMIDIVIPSAVISSKASNILSTDLYFSGKYLITALRHIITAANAVTAIELSRDTYTKDHEEFMKKSNSRLGV